MYFSSFGVDLNLICVVENVVEEANFSLSSKSFNISLVSPSLPSD
jgi:hypothetical protein